MKDVRLTARDRRLLAFAAEHRLFLGAHVQALLGISELAARKRLGSLCAADMLKREKIFDRQPACYQASRLGLGAIESPLPAPRIDLSCYQHDVGVAWLWLAAQAGSWGAAREVVSERQMRSHDGALGRSRAGHEGDPAGVRLGGTGPMGRERLHYPDLLLVDAHGRRIALELERTGKSRARRDRILSGYAADRRIDAVLYLVEDPQVGRAISSAARRLGILDLIHVQRVRFTDRPEAGREPGAARERRTGRERGAGGSSREAAR